MGIEPTSSAWKAEVLPLNYTRMVEGGGFEPPKVEPADLQSAPFGRSGTPPKTEQLIFLKPPPDVNQHREVIPFKPVASFTHRSNKKHLNCKYLPPISKLENGARRGI